MNKADQPKFTIESIEKVDKAPLDKPQAEAPVEKASSLTAPARQVSGFDWLALGVVILIAAFFTLTARLNTQPATSFVPVAVLSATGCGLLVTAIRKLRTSKGAGLLAAGLGGFFIALFQFTVAITYPGVFDALSQIQLLRSNFLITWGLIIGFSIIFSVAGAVLGHLAFAPLRLSTARPSTTAVVEEEEEEVEDSESSSEESQVGYTGQEEAEANVITASSESLNETTVETDEQNVSSTIENASEAAPLRQPSRSAFSYLVTVLLLGLAPTVVAYIFAAAYDYTLSLNQFIPGPYPTLRLLSTLLPWQVPLPINLHGDIGNIIIFSLLWRIPLFLGNPTLFDLQALEPFVFNGAALGLLLLTMHRWDVSSGNQSSSLNWMTFLLLEAALGLVLVLPANLWALRGLEGLLQFHDIVIPIRTLSILNTLTFSLNLITGPLVCMAIGIALKKILDQHRTNVHSR